jgi:predicted transcriptional regulator of viral defense system
MDDETSVSHVMHGKERFHFVDQAIAALAEGQFGVVSRAQLSDLGLGRGAIEGRLRRGQLHRVRRGAYAVGHRSLALEGRWMAAVLSAGPRAVLSHRSAAELWRLLPRSTRSIDVTRPTTFRSRAGIRGHCVVLPADEIAVVEGIPVTDLARTLLDVAASGGRQQAEAACNEAEVQGLTGKRSVPDLLARYSGGRGTAVLREIFGDDEAIRGITRRGLEERFAAILAKANLPPPLFNADLAVAGRFYEVDCLWTKQHLVAELDGRAVHETRRAFEKDRERDRLLQVEGWRVVRITWRQLRDDAPAVVADLHRLLRQ